MRITDKQRVFVQEYLVDLNATQAATRAGYSQRTARRIGTENVQKPVIKAAIEAAMAEREARTLITADYVLITIRDTVERCRQGEAVLDKEGNATGKWRFDAGNVLKGCELLGKHLGLFEKHQAAKNPGVSLAEELQEIFGTTGRLTLPSEDRKRHVSGNSPRLDYGTSWQYPRKT